MRVVTVVSFALSALACATTSSTTHEDTQEPKLEARAEAAPVAEPGPPGNFTAEEIAWAPFDPKKPEGIHVYPIKGNPQKGAFTALVKLPPGMKIPLHTHTHAYSAVTVTEGFASGKNEGAVQVLSKHTSWTQPAGNSHVNQCQSESSCIFAINFKGAVDMKPAKEEVAGEGEKRAYPGDAIPWVPFAKAPEKVKMHVFHGDMKTGPFDALIWFAAGMQTNIHTHASSFAGVVLQGEHHRGESPEALKVLKPGSAWHEAAGAAHMEKCAGPEDCVFMVSFNGPLDSQAVELKGE